MSVLSADQISYLVDKVPKYAYIKMSLINRIKSGELAVGNKIETESDLGKAYNCSRLTVRRAMEELYHEGFIYRIQGLGSFVKERISQKQNLDGINSCTALITAQNMVPSKTIISTELIGAPTDICGKFGIVMTDTVFFYSRVYYADGRPVIYGRSYFNAKYLPGIEKFDFSEKSIVSVLKDTYHLELKCSNRELKAVISDAQTSKLLGTPENFPLLQVTDLKTAVIQGVEVAIEYYTFEYVTDRIRYSPEIT